MTCPLKQRIFEGTHSDADQSEIMPEMVASTTTNNTSDDNHEIENEPLNYTTYLRLNILLSALKCLSHTDRSMNNSQPVHDEHFFILIHQVFELWFKQILFELDSIRYIFQHNEDITPFFFNINLRLNRTTKIWTMLIEQLQLLDTMSPVEFLEFRDFITPASGFQSHQYRLIEMKLGLTDPHRSSFKTNYFTKTMFKGQQSKDLEKSVEEKSLLFYIERWLERIYDSMSFQFKDEFESAVNRMIEHDRQEKILNGTDAETAKRSAETTKQTFAKMINPNEYEELLNNNERRISHRAMLSALMITLYHQEPCFQQSYKLLNLLIDIDGLMSSWRFKHMVLVQHQIGRKPGTAGTGGFSYLQKTISDQYQVFIDLANVSSYLIPQRFLPRLLNEAIQSTTPIPSLQLRACQEFPIIVKQQPHKRQYSSNEDLLFNYQIPLFFLLFSSGCLFAAFSYRFIL